MLPYPEARFRIGGPMRDKETSCAYGSMPTLRAPKTQML